MKRIIYKTAVDLPEEWDRICENNIFLKRNSLNIIEICNPCGQEYSIFYSSRPDSILVTYKLRLDILSYNRLSLKMPVTIAGIPLSVSKSGLSVGKETGEEVYRYLRSMPGGRLILNSDDTMPINKFATGTTLPTCRLHIRWRSFGEYMLNMRSHYRYRINKAREKWKGIIAERLNDNSMFDEDMYKLYLNVYNNSKYKLERLSISFFKSFPASITKFTDRERTIGFIQVVDNNEELIFLLGGFDYNLNFKYDIYINMLLEIVRLGIEGGYSVVDMGQTAEETKLKLGCTLINKYLYAGHSNDIINALIGKSIDVLSYNVKNYSYNIFKENNHEDIAGPAKF